MIINSEFNKSNEFYLEVITRVVVSHVALDENHKDKVDMNQKIPEKNKLHKFFKPYCRPADNIAITVVHELSFNL